MDLDRSQRYDIDEIGDDRITLALDELNYVSSPYSISLTKFSGNNWVKVDDAYVKYNIAEDDNISFIVPAVTELSEKNVTSLTVSFDYVVDSAIVIDNIALVHKDVIEQKTVESVISGTGHIDIVCDIFELKQDDVNTIISDEGFIIGINLDDNKSNTTARILNVNLSFEFDNKLQDEMNAVANRLSANLTDDSLIFKQDNYKIYYDKNSNADYDNGNELATLNDLPSVPTTNDIVNLIYPVGSIYMSVNNASPHTLFGGTWQQLTDTFLYASTSADTNSTTATAGESTHSLSESEMPRHTHTQNSHNHTQNAHAHNYGNKVPSIGDVDWQYTGARKMSYTSGSYYYPFSNKNTNGIGEDSATSNATATNQAQTATNKYTGGIGTSESASKGSAHNNMPPYMKVYMWKRIE